MTNVTKLCLLMLQSKCHQIVHMKILITFDKYHHIMHIKILTTLDKCHQIMHINVTIKMSPNCAYEDFNYFSQISESYIK